MLLHQLMLAVRTRERAVFARYCGDLATRRFHQGFEGHEVCEAVELLNLVVFKVLLRDPEGHALKDKMIDHVTITLRVGCDHARETFENLQARASWFSTESSPG